MPQNVIVPDYYPNDPDFRQGYIDALSNQSCEYPEVDSYLTGYKEGRLKAALTGRSRPRFVENEQ